MRGAPNAGVSDNFAPQLSHASPRRKPGDPIVFGMPPSICDDARTPDDLDSQLDIPAFLKRQPVGDQPLELIERLRSGSPLPMTIDDLAALGVSEKVLDCLRAIVSQEHGEQEVVTAWLAIFASTEEGKTLGWRFRRRIARASDRVMRKRVREALTVTHVP
jgi:hypothetical protein